MSQAISNMAVTWPDGSAYNGIRLSVSDTGPAAAGSNLLELRGGAAGTTSLFSVRKNGQIFFSQGVFSNTVALWESYSNAVNLSAASALTWSSGIPTIFSFDLALARDAANTLAQRNGANGQTFRVYNNFSTASDFDRGFIRWDANVLKIGTEVGGTFTTARALELQTDGVTRLTIGTGASNPVTFCGFAFTTNAGNGIFSSTWLSAGPGFLSINAGGVNQAVTLRFGGSTSTFPAIKRDGTTTTLEVKLADDSAYAPLAASQYSSTGANAQTTNVKQLTELTTIDAAATTDTTIEIPAGAILLGVTARVTVAITGTTTFDLGTAATADKFGDNVSSTATTTRVGSVAPELVAAATKIRITPDTTPSDNAGRVRITIHYIDLTAATS